MGERVDFNAEIQFPLYGLPQLVCDVVSEVATSRQAPLDYVVAPALVAIGVAMGSSAIVEDDYRNTLNLFVGVVGESSANKSKPSDDIFAPLYGINEKMLTAYNMERATYDQRAKEIMSSSKGKQAKAQLDLLERPTAKQIFLNDSTPESRIEAFIANPDGLLWHRDELKGLFDDFGRYHKSGEASDMLSVFDGKPIIVNRKTDGVKFAKAPWLSIFGTTQPSALWDTFGRSIFLDNGLVPRFLWFYPSQPITRDYSLSAKPDVSLMQRWRAFIEDLHNRQLNTHIHFGGGVRAVLDRFRNITGNGKSGYEATIWGKLHIAAYKLAGLAAVAHWANDGFVGVPLVKVEDMCWAIDCCHYLYRTQKQVETFCRYNAQSAGDGGMAAAIKQLITVCPTCNKNQLARAINRSRQYIYDTLKTQ